MLELLDEYTNNYVQGIALVISNCALLPAIIATFRRQLWFEFTSFLALFISSTVYHMTDAGLVQIPYINYHTLQTMDFCFGDYYAIVLILYITDLLPSSYLTIPRMISLYLIFFITLLGETESAAILWNLDEAVIGLVIVIFILPNLVKWIARGFPNYKWKYLLYGCLCSIAGALSGIFLEQWNYWFFHSLWHLCMMLGGYFFILFRDKDESMYVQAYPYQILLNVNEMIV